MKKLVAAFVGLNVLDITLTMIFVGMGTSTEINPVMARVLTWPLPAILFFKAVVPLMLGLALIALDKIPAARIVRPRAVLLALVLFMAGVCLFNLNGLLAV
jgi:hypothetical protein